MIEVTVTHNFETGHRLPHLPGKCQSLHGHSWLASVTIGAAAVEADGLLIDFGSLKAKVRGWIDAQLDHGLMLGHADPLVPILRPHGKVFIFGPELRNWPTVENVATLLADVAEQIIHGELGRPDLRLRRVVVQETAVNEAAWTV